MYLQIFASDDTLVGRVDFSALFREGFHPALVRRDGQRDKDSGEQLRQLVLAARAIEEPLEILEEEKELTTQVDILKLIASGAIQPPDELAAGSTDFHVTAALITRARRAIAAAEAP